MLYDIKWDIFNKCKEIWRKQDKYCSMIMMIAKKSSVIQFRIS